MAKAGALIFLLWLLAAPLALAAPPPAPASPAAAQAEAEINALLQRAAAAVARKDMPSLSALLDDEAEVEVRGLNLDRRSKGRQRIRALYGPELMAAEPAQVEFRQTRVQALGARASLEAGLVAYVVPELPGGLQLGGQQRLPVPGRLSAILEKRGRAWVFLRLLLVFPGGAR